jgi:membrane-associated protease RseP (regulator of RpoE activity)
VETVLLYILGVVVMLLGVLVSIGLHEVGHLIPAKKFGVHVGQYMIGFGKTLWSRKVGDTEYGLKAIPLGGYISMAGMYPPAKGETVARDSSTGFMDTLMQDARDTSQEGIHEEHEGRVFYKLASWKRIIIMLGGPAMNLLIGIVLYTIVLCGFGVVQATTTVGSVAECLKPATSSATECAATDTPAPAAAAGFLPGDRIVSIDGTPIDEVREATAIINSSPGEQLTIVIERDGAEKSIDVTPDLTEVYKTDSDNQIVEDADGNPVTEERGIMGVTFAEATVQQPITAVGPVVGDNIVRVGHLILNLPQRLIDVVNAAFGPEERDPNGPLSVVGVGRIAGEITSLNTIPVADRVSSLIQILASLNIALFVFNLIPLLPLDGGHVAGALFDAVRRFFARLFKRPEPRPIDIARLIPVTLAVTVLLGAMSILLIYADIVKPISIL